MFIKYSLMLHLSFLEIDLFAICIWIYFLNDIINGFLYLFLSFIINVWGCFNEKKTKVCEILAKWLTLKSVYLLKIKLSIFYLQC